MRVHWILVGSRRTASSRLQGYAIHAQLCRRGYDSRILLSPPPPIEHMDLPWDDPARVAATDLFAPGDAVVFQTVHGPRAVALAQALQCRGVRIVHVDCDLDLHPDTPLARLADALVYPSVYLADLYAQRYGRPATVIPDALESMLPEHQLATRHHGRTANLRLLWIGAKGNWQPLAELLATLQRPELADLQLHTVSDHPRAQQRWSHTAAVRALRTADIVVIPTADTAAARSKSNNRLTQAMALGAAVVAGPIPAYRACIEPGVNGLLAQSPDQWFDALTALRDPIYRRTVARNGWRTAQQYTPDAVLPAWKQALGLPEHPSSEDRRTPHRPRWMRVQELRTYAMRLRHECGATAATRYFLRELAVRSYRYAGRDALEVLSWMSRRLVD